jgi:hypothetical protein
MRHYHVTGIVGLFVLCLLGFNPIAAADTSGRPPSVQIEKTFDQGTLITHTLTLVNPPHTVSLNVSQRRASEGSEDIEHTYLGFRHKAPEDAPPMTQQEFERSFGALLAAFQDKFGADLVPESLGSGGFMGIGAVETSSAQAFRDFAPWETYLAKPSNYSQWQIHGIVLERWKTTNVYAPVVAALASAGYEAELSGFEKLFVFEVTKFKTHPELEVLGIPGNKKLPYPGTIAFTLKARR